MLDATRSSLPFQWRQACLLLQSGLARGWMRTLYDSAIGNAPGNSLQARDERPENGGGACGTPTFENYVNPLTVARLVAQLHVSIPAEAPPDKGHRCLVKGSLIGTRDAPAANGVRVR